MTKMVDVPGAALEVHRLCAPHAWQYGVIGGVAVQRWGNPRFTVHVDLTLLAGYGREERFPDQLLAALIPRRPDERPFALQHREAPAPRPRVRSQPRVDTMAQWLVKEEPDHYGFDRLVTDGRTVWSGVKNPLAQKHLRAIRKGDRLFYYHTGKERAVVATATASSDAYPDPADRTGRLFAVDVVPEKRLPRPVTLAEIKADPAFAAFPLVRMARLSVMPVSSAEWTRIEKMSRSAS